MPLAPPREGTPTTLGPYRLLAALGAGGMGEVHLAAPIDSPPTPTTLVALKTVRQDLELNPDFRTRFRREIAASRLVDSPLTAKLLNGDADGQPPWLATEFVPGPTLGEAVRAAGPLPARTVRGLGLGLVRALASVHRAQVLHRDLKPGNVLLSAAGPKLIDFGIARAFGATTMTATGVMMGTPGFMSPEHVAGGRTVVAASDVFCSASLLCYAASGRSPFGDGPVAAVLYRVSEAEADLSEVPPELRELLADCLRRDPAERPELAELDRRLAATGEVDFTWPEPVRELIDRRTAEVAELCARSAEPPATAPRTAAGSSPAAEQPTGELPPVGPTQPLDRSARTARRRPRPRNLAVLGAAGLALGVLAAYGLQSVLGDDGNPPPPKNSKNSTAGSAGTSPTSAPRKPVALDAAGSAEGSLLFPTADRDHRPPGWKPWHAKFAARPTGCALTSRALVCRLADGSLQALNPADGSRLWRHKAAPKGATAPAATPDGTAVVSAEDGWLRLRDAFTGKERRAGTSLSDVQVDGSMPVLVNRKWAVVTGRYGGSSALKTVNLATGKLLTGEQADLLGGMPVGGEGKQLPEFGALATAGYVTWAIRDSGLSTIKRDERGQVLEMRSAVATGGLWCAGLRLHDGKALCEEREREGLATPTLYEVEKEGASGLKFGRKISLPPGLALAGTQFGAWNGRVLLGVGIGKVHVLDTATGKTRTVADLTAPKDSDGNPTISTPVLVGDTAVYADNESVTTLPTGKAGAEPTTRRVKGAPGNDAGSPPPIVIPAGGILCLAYHDGSVRTAELP